MWMMVPSNVVIMMYGIFFFFFNLMELSQTSVVVDMTCTQLQQLNVSKNSSRNILTCNLDSLEEMFFDEKNLLYLVKNSELVNCTRWNYHQHLCAGQWVLGPHVLRWGNCRYWWLAAKGDVLPCCDGTICFARPAQCGGVGMYVCPCNYLLLQSKNSIEVEMCWL